MKAKVFLGIILASAAIAVGIAILYLPAPSLRLDAPIPDASLAYKPVEPASQPETLETPRLSGAPAKPLAGNRHSEGLVEQPVATSTDKLERLAQTREAFKRLAVGDPGSAIRAARKVANETERETALLTLVTEWTHGELGPPRARARAISAYGLDAGLGMELSKDPQLASLWASELTDPAARLAVLREAASSLLDSDPKAAFGYSEQISAEDRPKFFTGLYANWAQKDTDAALRWAEQLPDLTQQAGALDAIRSVAPVGIGAALAIQEGYPVVLDVLPGTPADLGGQLHKGDRILGLSRGDNSFVDARNVSLADVVQMVRGPSGSLLQLQVLPADSPPNSQPKTISIVRDQVKFKK